MKHFGWKAWRRLLARKRGHGLEREVLKFLHSPVSLRLLAKAVASRVAAPGYQVTVQSIWIDGTPQATFTDAAGSLINCELADLLLLVRVVIPGWAHSERGLLLQAKLSPRHNRLTSGSSTKKERRLLERINRNLALELHKNTARTSPIGRYTLGHCIYGYTGLRDCAQYLLAPKAAGWVDVPNTFAPYQVGWPNAYPFPRLTGLSDLSEAAIRVGIGRIGRAVEDPAMCEWSRLVEDLRGDYTGVAMPGYGHERVERGGVVCFLASSGVANSFSYGWSEQIPDGYFPGSNNPAAVNFQRPPSIPIMIVTIQAPEGVEQRL